MAANSTRENNDAETPSSFIRVSRSSGGEIERTRDVQPATRQPVAMEIEINGTSERTAKVVTDRDALFQGQRSPA